LLKNQRKQIDAISRQITGQANVNSVEISSLPFPLPPRAIQNKIAAYITNLKEQIQTLRKQAEELRANAKSEFEKAVFDQ
jgi:restriction endonuclease S subunit